MKVEYEVYEKIKKGEMFYPITPIESSRCIVMMFMAITFSGEINFFEYMYILTTRTYFRSEIMPIILYHSRH